MPNTTSSLRARNLMTADPICVRPAATIRDLARVFEEHEISGVPVTDAEGRLIGVVSKTDLIRRCSESSGDVAPAYLFEAISAESGGASSGEVIPEPLVCVEDLMTRDPLTVGPNVPAASVANLMFARRVHRVIVVDQERIPLGIITSMDLLGSYVQH
jgi:CBS domain-containing protein